MEWLKKDVFTADCLCFLSLLIKKQISQRCTSKLPLHLKLSQSLGWWSNESLMVSHRVKQSRAGQKINSNIDGTDGRTCCRQAWSLVMVFCIKAVVLLRDFFFTSTSLFVQEFVPRGTVTLVTDSPVPADVGAATIVVCTFVQACRKRGSVGRKDGERDKHQREER